LNYIFQLNSFQQKFLTNKKGNFFHSVLGFVYSSRSCDYASKF